MFHFHCVQIVQAGLPFAVLREVVGDSLGKKDVAGIAAIHHPLGQVIRRRLHCGAGCIKDFIDRAAVNAHAHWQLRIVSKFAADFLRATHRRVHAGKKRQHHSVTGRQANQFTSASAARNCWVSRTTRSATRRVPVACR